MLWLLAQVFAAVFVHFIIDRIGSQTCFLGAAASVFISIFVQAIVGAPHSLHIFIVDHFSTSFFSKVSEIAGNKFCQELLVSSPFFERFFIFFIPRVSGMLFFNHFPHFLFSTYGTVAMVPVVLVCYSVVVHEPSPFELYHR